MNEPPTIPTRTSLLQRLKQGGPGSAESLAGALGVTPMAVRQHLYALKAAGVVAFECEPRPVGRPVKMWRLTEGADRFFADRHAELALALLGAVEAAFGLKGIERLLRTRTLQQIEDYRGRIPAEGSLASRLRQLARQRSAEGYMAEVKTGPDGASLLIENHCPICAAARACRGLCGSELEVFQAVLGPEAAVERTEHILSGDRRCVYAVKPRSRNNAFGLGCRVPGVEAA